MQANKQRKSFGITGRVRERMSSFVPIKSYRANHLISRDDVKREIDAVYMMAGIARSLLK